MRILIRIGVFKISKLLYSISGSKRFVEGGKRLHNTLHTEADGSDWYQYNLQIPDHAKCILCLNIVQY